MQSDKDVIGGLRPRSIDRILLKHDRRSTRLWKTRPVRNRVKRPLSQRKRGAKSSAIVDRCGSGWLARISCRTRCTPRVIGAARPVYAVIIMARGDGSTIEYCLARAQGPTSLSNRTRLLIKFETRLVRGRHRS